MHPEIKYVRESKTPVSRKDLAAKFPYRASALDMSLSRAVRDGLIVRVGYGAYANPKRAESAKPECTIEGHAFDALIYFIATFRDDRGSVDHAYLTVWDYLWEDMGWEYAAWKILIKRWKQLANEAPPENRSAILYPLDSEGFADLQTMLRRYSDSNFARTYLASKK